MGEEHIIIVDKNDEFLYITPRSQLRGEEFNRATAIWIRDKEGSILLAKRAKTKRFDPGKWSSGAAGNVGAEETYDSNAEKELFEELGISNVVLEKKFKMKVDQDVIPQAEGNYFVQWYEICIDRNTPIILQENEVEEVRWYTPYELKELMEKTPEIFATPFLLGKEEILKFLE